MKYLLIGGPADGRRIELTERRHLIDVADIPNIPLMDLCNVDLSFKDLTFKIATYHAKYFREKFGEEILMYVHRTIKDVDILKHLIEGYRENHN